MGHSIHTSAWLAYATPAPAEVRISSPLVPLRSLRFTPSRTLAPAAPSPLSGPPARSLRLTAVCSLSVCVCVCVGLCV